MNVEFLDAIRNGDTDEIGRQLSQIPEERRDYVLNAPIGIQDPSLDPEKTWDTPLLFCIKCGGLSGGRKSVEFLVDHGADLSVPNPETGITPLMEAARADFSDPVIGVKKLLDLGAAVRAIDNRGETALDWARRAVKARRAAANEAMEVDPNNPDLKWRYDNQASADRRLIEKLEDAERITRAIDFERILELKETPRYAALKHCLSF